MRAFIKYICLVLCLACCTTFYAQKQTDLNISYQCEEKPLIKILYDLAIENDLNFYFRPEELPTFKLSGDFQDQQVYIVIQHFLNGTKLKVLPYQDDGILIIHADKLNKTEIAEIVQSWDEGDLNYPLNCLLYTSPSPRDATLSRMPSSA